LAAFYKTVWLQQIVVPKNKILVYMLPVSQPFYGPFSGTTWVSRCQKRTSGLYGAREDLTEADTPTIRMGATPSGLVTSAQLHHPPYFSQARCPSCHPTNSVKAPKACHTCYRLQF